MVVLEIKKENKTTHFSLKINRLKIEGNKEKSQRLLDMEEEYT